MTFRPRAAQLETLRRSWRKEGFAHYLEQGLGKTGTILSEFQELASDDVVDCMVVVAPSTFCAGWVRECEQHGFNLQGHHYESRSGSVNSWFLRSRKTLPDFVVINYESARGVNGQAYVREFIKGRRGLIVLDESVQIADPGSLQTKTLLTLSKEFKYRRLLSGKPQKQGPHDYWAQMRFLGALDGFNFYAFRNTFCEMGGFKGKVVKKSKNEERLAKLLEPYCFFAKKSDYTDLPPKIWSQREYNLGPVLQNHYDTMLEEFVTWLSDDEVVTIDVAITKYIKLAQIQAGYIIDEAGKARELVAPKSNPRFLALREFIETELSGKATMPYNSKFSGALLFRELSGYNPAYIWGGMAGIEIEAQKERFNSDPSCRIILLQTRAAKYGHTLLGGAAADRCHTTLMYENTYSLDDRGQIEDRNHRYGQDADCCDIIDFVGTDLDRDCIASLLRKESMFQVLRDYVTSRQKR